MVTARSRSVTGFTLVELLIAMAIATLVIGLATFSFNLFSRDWQKRASGFEESAARLQRFDLLSNAVESAVPWTIRNKAGRYGYYFLGRPEGLTLVTADSIFGGGAPAVIRIFRENEPGGTARLVYEEASLAGLTLVDADQTLPFKHRMIVLSGVKNLEFRYFGWRSSADRMGGDVGGSAIPKWWEEFDGLQRGEHPMRVQIGFEGASAVYFMPDRPSVSSE